MEVGGVAMEPGLVPVTELRQWTYCPRVVYYHMTMPGAGRNTYKMEEGLRAQEMFESLEMRRTLREYGLSGAKREFGIWLSDGELGLSGKLDVLLRGDEVAAVVDFKLTAGGVGENHKVQLAGYSLLVEKLLGLKAETAFLFRIPDDQVFAVPVTVELRESVKRVVAQIRWMRENEELPDATANRGKCVECEYMNYCGDVW